MSSDKDFSISVTNLVYWACRTQLSHDSNQQSKNNLPADHKRGIAAHQQIQASKKENYQAEVTIRHLFKLSELTLSVEGRIDGVETLNNEITVIEEIKSSNRSFEDISESDRQFHLAQAKMYGYLHHQVHQGTHYQLRLTYIDLKNPTHEATNSHDITPAELEQFCKPLIEQFAAFISQQIRHQQERDHSISQLTFPLPQYRPHQRELAKATFIALREQQELFAEAATGLGKSIAFLFAAVKAIPTQSFQTLWYFTCKNSGQESALEAARQLIANNGKIRVLQLSSQQNSCFCSQPNSQLTPDTCIYRSEFFNHFHNALDQALETDLLCSGTIKSIAEHHQICPHQLSIELIPWVDIVIADANYGMDLNSNQLSQAQRWRFPQVALFDEAHNLIDRARKGYSTALSYQELKFWQDTLKQLYPTVSKSFSKVMRQLNNLAKQANIEAGDLNKLIHGLQEVTTIIDENQQELAHSLLFSDLKLYYFELHYFLKIAPHADHNYRFSIETRGKNKTLNLDCLNPVNLFTKQTGPLNSKVFFSATLTPFHYFQSQLSNQANTLTARFPSPFPPEHLKVCIIPSVDTRYQQREYSLSSLCDWVEIIIHAQPGNYLVTLPSFEYLKQVHQELATRTVFSDDTRELIAQDLQMNTQAREFFLNQLCSDTKATTALAISGGLFAEGVDLKGDQLIGALIVGPALPMADDNNEHIKQLFDEQGFDGYEFAYRLPGWIRVLQTAGRVIRDESDKGVVVLFDPRFAQPAYRKLHPPHWQPSTIRAQEQLREELADFWS